VAAIGKISSSEYAIDRRLSRFTWMPIEGLRNPTVVQDTTALAVFPLRPIGIRQAIAKAVADDHGGAKDCSRGGGKA